MAYSFSALKMYETCPRQFHEVRILNLHPRQETEATIWGTKIHEAAEKHVRDGAPLEFDFPGQDVVKALGALSYEKHCELEMAVNESLEPVAFGDPTAFIRGIADVVLVQGTKARILDYKTGGNKYPDTSQLELMALLLFALRPEIEISHGALLFLTHDTMVQAITKRERSQELWSKWFGKVARIEEAKENGVWNAKPSGLCRQYCPCTSCEHNGRR